ncbi:hypothetical protein K438DRAFT_1767255 [Mycena galopus ATCC 62051]|nr:hypothetical protein K438DRAFT_1767255 [Mycena galopus ATCC 62051]
MQNTHQVCGAPQCCSPGSIFFCWQDNHDPSMGNLDVADESSSASGASFVYAGGASQSTPGEGGDDSEITRSESRYPLHGHGHRHESLVIVSYARRHPHCRSAPLRRVAGEERRVRRLQLQRDGEVAGALGGDEDAVRGSLAQRTTGAWAGTSRRTAGRTRMASGLHRSAARGRTERHVFPDGGIVVSEDRGSSWVGKRWADGRASARLGRAPAEAGILGTKTAFQTYKVASLQAADPDGEKERESLFL